MKIPKEVINGFLIFLGIGLFFLIINALGHGHNAYLRLVNIVFIFYGVNRTLQMNFSEGKTGFMKNIVAGMITCMIGIALSLVGLLTFSYIKGGENYLQSLSESFLFGGNPSITSYVISLFFEGTASAIIITFMLMLYHNNKFKTN